MQYPVPGAPVRIVDDSGAAVTPGVSSGNVASGAADSGNPVKVGGVFNSSTPTLDNGDRGDLQLDSKGSLRITIAGAANSQYAGVATLVADALTAAQVPALYVHAFGWVFNGTSYDRVKKPNLTSRIPSAAATTNATVAKASAGDLHHVTGYNAAASVRYIKFYNIATAPTVGTTAIVHMFALPPTAPFNIILANPFYFSAGISYALTTGAADADTGALTLADVVGLSVAYA